MSSIHKYTIYIISEALTVTLMDIRNRHSNRYARNKVVIVLHSVINDYLKT